MHWKQNLSWLGHPSIPHPSLLAWAFFFAIAAMIAPLWSAHYLPFVDLPQHLSLINVLGHLDDPNTLYPEVFQRRYELTPYLSYYYTVWLLSHIFGLYTANAIFLSLVAIATPLSVGALAKRLGGSFWIGILACPLFYGDNLYWGFINYCTSLPLLLFAITSCLAVLEETPHPRYLREIGLALLMVALQITHELAFGFLGLAMLLSLLLTPSDWQRRIRVVAAAIPSATVFSIWWIGRLAARPEPGSPGPWQGWGKVFSWESFDFFFTPLQNLRRLREMLANGFFDQSDQRIVMRMAVLALVTLILGLAYRKKEIRSWRVFARGPLLALIALSLYLFLPFHISGFVAIINTRFAVIFALLVIAALPFPSVIWAQRTVAITAMAICLWYGAILTAHFRKFDMEAAPMNDMIAAMGPKPKIVSLLQDLTGKVTAHVSYLHFPCYAAIERGGITSASFAQSTLSPLEYKIPIPPCFSHFNPHQFDYNAHGRYYDYYLVHGQMTPHAIFREFENEVRLIAQSGDFTLYTRRPPETQSPESACLSSANSFSR